MKKFLVTALIAITVSTTSFATLSEVALAQTANNSTAGALAGGLSGAASCAATGGFTSLGGSSAAAAAVGFEKSAEVGGVSAAAVSAPGLAVADIGARTALVSIASSNGIIATANVSQAGDSKWQVLKSNVLNCIFYTISRMALQAMTASVISWANSGFQGNPSFIQDPKAFFSGVVDQSIGQVLNNSEFTKWMCSPFRLQIQRSLVYNTSFMSRSQCSLSGVVNNFDGFINSVNNSLGTLGGWGTWNQISTIPQNNPYGAYTVFNAEVNAVITGNINVQQNLLNWGRGFFEYRDPSCVASAKEAQNQEISSYEDTGGDVRNDDPSKCKILTPGDVISSQVNTTLGVGKDELINAKEINELVGALMAGLVTKVFSSGGLFGLGGSSNSASSYFAATVSGGGFGGSYVQQLNNDSTQQFSANQATNLNQIELNKGTENRYVAVKNQSVARVESTASSTRAVIACYSTITATSSRYTLSDAERANATTTLAAAQNTLSQLLTLQNSLKKDVALGNANITNIQKISDAIANTTPDKQDQMAAIMRQFAQLSNFIHYEADAINAEYELSTVIPNKLVPIETALSNSLNDCRTILRR